LTFGNFEVFPRSTSTTFDSIPLFPRITPPFVLPIIASADLIKPCDNGCTAAAGSHTGVNSVAAVGSTTVSAITSSSGGTYGLRADTSA